MTKHGWLRCAKEGTQPQVLVSLVGRSLLHISQTSESVIVALGLVIDAEGMTGLRYACAHEQIYCLDPACEDRLDSIYRARTNRAADAVIATVSLFNTVDDEMTEATTLPALRESVRGTDKRLSQPRSRGPLVRGTSSAAASHFIIAYNESPQTLDQSPWNEIGICTASRPRSRQVTGEWIPCRYTYGYSSRNEAEMEPCEGNTEVTPCEQGERSEEKRCWQARGRVFSKGEEMEVG